MFGYFFSVLDELSYKKAASTFLLRADLQEWSVNYADSYLGFSNGNGFQHFLLLQASDELMFTNKTCSVLWTIWLRTGYTI